VCPPNPVTRNQREYIQCGVTKEKEDNSGNDQRRPAQKKEKKCLDEEKKTSGKNIRNANWEKKGEVKGSPRYLFQTLVIGDRKRKRERVECKISRDGVHEILEARWNRRGGWEQVKSLVDIHRLRGGHSKNRKRRRSQHKPRKRELQQEYRWGVGVLGGISVLLSREHS